MFTIFKLKKECLIVNHNNVFVNNFKITKITIIKVVYNIN